MKVYCGSLGVDGSVANIYWAAWAIYSTLNISIIKMKLGLSSALHTNINAISTYISANTSFSVIREIVSAAYMAPGQERRQGYYIMQCGPGWGRGVTSRVVGSQLGSLRYSPGGNYDERYNQQDADGAASPVPRLRLSEAHADGSVGYRCM